MTLRDIFCFKHGKHLTSTKLLVRLTIFFEIKLPGWYFKVRWRGGSWEWEIGTLFEKVQFLEAKLSSMLSNHIGQTLYHSKNHSKNPVYGRQWISRPMQIVGLIQFWRQWEAGIWSCDLKKSYMKRGQQTDRHTSRLYERICLWADSLKTLNTFS